MIRRSLANWLFHSLRTSPVTASEAKKRLLYSFESLEDRLTPAVTASFSTGALSILGDTVANDISISSAEVSGTKYLMVFDGSTNIFDGRPSGQNVTAGSVASIDVNAGAGADVINLSAVSAANGFAGLNDSVMLYGGADADTITGSSFADRLVGEEGNDSLQGGEEGDYYWYTAVNAGTDTLTESISASGSDAVLFFEADVAVTLNLSLTTSQSWGDGTIILSGSSVFENLGGSSQADTLTGNSLSNFLMGAGGNDSLAGGLGDDYYFFGADAAGSDTLTEAADAGEDALLFGDADVAVTISLALTSSQTWGDGTITLSSGATFEFILGSNFNDSLTGNDLNNIFLGGPGNDTLAGGQGDDIYYYAAEAAGTDTLTENASSGNDWVRFDEADVAVTFSLATTSSQAWGDGSIILSSDVNFEFLAGSLQADSLTGNSVGNLLQGLAGNDTLAGGLGDDIYYYAAEAAGTDTLMENASSGNDWVRFDEADVAVTFSLATTSSQAWGDGSIILSSDVNFEFLAGSPQADNLTGNSVGNILEGLAGNDTLAGGGSSDRYVFSGGTLGTDTITEAANSDTDELDFSGMSTYIGISLDVTGNQVVSLAGLTLNLSTSTSIEMVAGSAFGDTINGNSRNNVLVGNGGNDILKGLEGNDTLEGGDGDDFYFYTSVAAGSDLITEAANLGTDTLFFEAVDVGVTIDLSSTSAQSWGDGTITLSSATGIEDVVGGAYADSITGNDRANVLRGNAGNNTLQGGAGGDYLLSDAGSDSLVGGSGDDSYTFLAGPNGSDTIVEAANSDSLDALDFTRVTAAVTIDASSTSAQNWGDGTITISSSTGIEVLIGSPQADSLTGNSRDNVISSDAGNDMLSGQGGRDTLYASTGNDTLTGNQGDDVLVGGGGDDSLDGSEGNDIYYFLSNNEGTDILSEASSADADVLHFGSISADVTINLSTTVNQSWGGGTLLLSSTTGIESVVTGGGHDSVSGNTRSNVIRTNGGNDTILSGDGNDTLIGGDGSNSMAGGNGSDTYAISTNTGHLDQITESANDASDSISFADTQVGVTLDLGTTAVQSWGGGSLMLSSSTSIENVQGGAFDDEIRGNSRNNVIIGFEGHDTLRGMDGDDQLRGYTGDDELIGGNGNDTITGAEGNDILDGGLGSDTYVFEATSQGTDSIIELANSDDDWLDFGRSASSVIMSLSSTSPQNWGQGTLTVSDANSIEHVFGSSSGDQITGNARSNILLGNAGNDTIEGSGGDDSLAGDTGNDSLLGGDGNDFLLGDDGNDIINGNDGVDILVGGTSADTLEGGSGDDILVASVAVSPLGTAFIQLMLDLIYSAWTTSLNYVDAVLNVTGDAAGSAPLIANFRIAKNETVYDDASEDILSGNTGNDLFVIDSGEDTITDQGSLETFIDIG